MGNRLLGLIALIVFLISCKGMNQVNKTAAPETYDHVFAGAAVYQIGENILTSSAVYEVEKDGETVLCSKVRINDGARTRIYTGDLLDLKDGKQVKVLAITPAEDENGTGKIYLGEL